MLKRAYIRNIMQKGLVGPCYLSRLSNLEAAPRTCGVPSRGSRHTSQGSAGLARGTDPQCMKKSALLEKLHTSGREGSARKKTKHGARGFRPAIACGCGSRRTSLIPAAWKVLQRYHEQTRLTKHRRLTCHSQPRRTQWPNNPLSIPTRTTQNPRSSSWGKRYQPSPRAGPLLEASRWVGSTQEARFQRLPRPASKGYHGLPERADTTKFSRLEVLRADVKEVQWGKMVRGMAQSYGAKAPSGLTPHAESADSPHRRFKEVANLLQADNSCKRGVLTV